MPTGNRRLGSSIAACHFLFMSLSEVQREVTALSADERRKLAAFLTTLRMKDTGEWEQATQTGDADRTGWISLDEAKQRLLRGN